MGPVRWLKQNKRRFYGNEKTSENRKHFNGGYAPGGWCDFFRRGQELHEPGRYEAACNDGADSIDRRPQPDAQGQEREAADNPAHRSFDDERAQERG